MPDGGMLLTVMPIGAYSRASDLVNEINGTLRRGVVGHLRRSALGARRRDHDDPPPLRLDHVGQRDLAAVERAGQVDVDESRPGLRGDVEERREPNQPGAGHQDADRPQFGADLRERLVHRRPVGDVHRDGQCLDAFGAQVFGHALRGVAVDVENGDSVAATAEVVARCLAHARRPAGDHCDPTHGYPFVADRSLLIDDLDRGTRWQRLTGQHPSRRRSRRVPVRRC